MEQLYLIQLGLIGILLAASVVLFGKAAMSRGDSMLIASGHFLWLWCAGGILLMLFHVAKSILS